MRIRSWLELAISSKSVIPMSLYRACIFLALLATSSLRAAPQGYMEGHLNIVFAMAAAPSDEMTAPPVPPETYAAYPLVILTQQGKKEIARLTADANGNYRAALPPGDYILDVQERTATHIHGSPQPFRVIPNQTVRVNLRIFAGFHKGQASQALGREGCDAT
jgi:hypothetical protein